MMVLIVFLKEICLLKAILKQEPKFMLWGAVIPTEFQSTPKQDIYIGVMLDRTPGRIVKHEGPKVLMN